MHGCPAPARNARAHTPAHRRWAGAGAAEGLVEGVSTRARRSHTRGFHCLLARLAQETPAHGLHAHGAQARPMAPWRRRPLRRRGGRGLWSGGGRQRARWRCWRGCCRAGAWRTTPSSPSAPASAPAERPGRDRPGSARAFRPRPDPGRPAGRSR